MSVIVTVAAIWFLAGLLIAVPIGRAIAAADHRDAVARTAAMRRHPSGKHLSDSEVVERFERLVVDL